jgi:hypothetical protein
MFVPMLLPNEPKLMMFHRHQQSLQDRRSLFRRWHRKPLRAYILPGPREPVLSNCYRSLNKPAAQEVPIEAFQQTDATSPNEWGGHRDLKQFESANVRRRMQPHSEEYKREA